MARLVLVMIVILTSTYASGSHVNKGDELSESSPSKKVVDVTVHISEAGEEYNENIEVDPNKRTELFQVPAHPGVDRSDTLHDFKQKITIVRFPDTKNCYVFPLQSEQSAPKKLIRDLVEAKKTVITETRRVDTTWVTNNEVTDRAALGDELADFCAQYRIFYVKEAQESLEVTGIRTEGRTNRVRRQSESGLANDTALCPGGMDLSEAREACSNPELDCKTEVTCSKFVKCRNVTRNTNNVRDQRLHRFHLRHHFHHFYFRHLRLRRDSPSLPRQSVVCTNFHTTRKVTVCCKYICSNTASSNKEEAEIFQWRFFRPG